MSVGSSEFVPSDLLLCPALIGRDRERALLVERLESAAAGHGAVTGLVGEAGAGKTRLTREVIDHAARLGMRMLTGRCVPAEVPTPYRPSTESYRLRLRVRRRPSGATAEFLLRLHRRDPLRSSP